MTPFQPGEDPNRTRFLSSNRAVVGPIGDRVEFERELSRFHSLLPQRSRLAVLEVGCGSGRWSVRWTERGHHVTGVDFDVDLLRLCYQREGLDRGNFQAVAADALRLPLAAGRFDVVTLYSLLEHVSDWRPVVSEAARVLAPGGVLLLHTTNRWHPFQGEVNHFPFYPWLPDAIKQRVLAWIMKHRRDLVNYTDYPAIHWFSYPGLMGALRALGLEPYDRLDLTEPSRLTGIKRLGRFMLRNGERPPRARALHYLLAGTVSLYARKPDSGPGPVAPAPGPKPS